jgi:type IV pilus assembly protein PilV
MQMRNSNRRFRRGVAGVSLIEVMISVLVMGIGMLGIAAMQATALRNNQSALERSQAVIQSYTILDAMRANVAFAREGDYDMAMTCDEPATGALSENDTAAWIRSLKDTMGPTACGAIDCDDDAVCTVTVQWDDSRGTGGGDEQSFETVTRL